MDPSGEQEVLATVESIQDNPEIQAESPEDLAESLPSENPEDLAEESKGIEGNKEHLYVGGQVKLEELVENEDKTTHEHESEKLHKQDENKQDVEIIEEKAEVQAEPEILKVDEEEKVEIKNEEPEVIKEEQGNAQEFTAENLEHQTGLIEETSPKDESHHGEQIVEEDKNSLEEQRTHEEKHAHEENHSLESQHAQEEHQTHKEQHVHEDQHTREEQYAHEEQHFHEEHHVHEEHHTHENQNPSDEIHDYETEYTHTHNHEEHQSHETQNAGEEHQTHETLHGNETPETHEAITPHKEIEIHNPDHENVHHEQSHETLDAEPFHHSQAPVSHTILESTPHIHEQTVKAADPLTLESVENVEVIEAAPSKITKSKQLKVKSKKPADSPALQAANQPKIKSKVDNVSESALIEEIKPQIKASSDNPLEAKQETQHIESHQVPVSDNPLESHHAPAKPEIHIQQQPKTEVHYDNAKPEISAEIKPASGVNPQIKGEHSHEEKKAYQYEQTTSIIPTKYDDPAIKRDKVNGKKQPDARGTASCGNCNLF